MYLQRNNRLVWDETVKIMQGLFNDLWANQDVVSVNHVVDLTLPVGCLIDHLILLRSSPLGFTDCTLRYWSCRYAHTITLLFFHSLTRFLGFGRSVSWKEDGTIIPPGHMMTYKDALHIATTDFIFKLTIPGWALGLTPRLRKVKLGFEELHVRHSNFLFISEVISV